MCFVGLELPVKFPRFCKSVHRERYLSHFIDERQCFLSKFLYKLKKNLYEQPQIGFFFQRDCIVNEDAYDRHLCSVFEIGVS